MAQNKHLLRQNITQIFLPSIVKMSTKGLRFSNLVWIKTWNCCTQLCFLVITASKRLLFSDCCLSFWQFWARRLRSQLHLGILRKCFLRSHCQFTGKEACHTCGFMNALGSAKILSGSIESQVRVLSRFFIGTSVIKTVISFYIIAYSYIYRPA